MCLDTGCVFGGRLTALRYPERELVSVPAARGVLRAGQAVPGQPRRRRRRQRPPGASRTCSTSTTCSAAGSCETAHHGRISVREENAAAALEVMSRFAVDPRWLVYLPPTMSPVATSTRPGAARAPGRGVRRLPRPRASTRWSARRSTWARAPSPWSAATLDAARTGSASPRRAPAPCTPGPGARSSAPSSPTSCSPGCARRAESGRAVRRAGHRLAAARRRAAAVERQGRGPAARPVRRGRRRRPSRAARRRSAALEQAAASGLDVGDLLDRTRSRAGEREAFTAAYRRYCWPTDGLDGVRLAPFQVLAGRGAAYHDRRPHAWHLELADRLVAADPELVAADPAAVVDTTDPESVGRRRAAGGRS